MYLSIKIYAIVQAFISCSIPLVNLDKLVYLGFAWVFKMNTNEGIYKAVIIHNEYLIISTSKYLLYFSVSTFNIHQ